MFIVMGLIRGLARDLRLPLVGLECRSVKR